MSFLFGKGLLKDADGGSSLLSPHSPKENQGNQDGPTLQGEQQGTD